MLADFRVVSEPIDKPIEMFYTKGRSEDKMNDIQTGRTQFVVFPGILKAGLKGNFYLFY